MLKKDERKYFALILILTALAGYVTGRLTAPERVREMAVPVPDSQDVREKRDKEGYQFINPLLDCDNYKPSLQNSEITIERDVKDCIAKMQSEKKVSFASVYFRDLNLGPWVGVNEDEYFAPASLLKVPILVAALKKAETEPGFLKKKFVYTEILDKTVVPNITDPNLIKLGMSYSIDELMERMIEYSDNEAKELLLRTLDPNFLLKVMADIGLNITRDLNGDFVSVKEYSEVFRLLYNGTYLSRELSEKALQILSKTRYAKGLVAGLPQRTTIAHKFGERAYSDSNIKQLHECGIVYSNNAPYLICVMTRGADFDQQASVIAAISGIIYKDVQEIK